MIDIPYEDLKDYRNKNHAVIVTQFKSMLYGTEYELKITHNGNQYTSFSLNKEECEMVIDSMSKAIKEQPHD